jgi:threonine/homoserine/homoserine lactone efflux protein
MTAELPEFLTVSTLVIVTPGKDTLLTIRNTLIGGRVGGVCTAVGVAAGLATWTILSSIGVVTLLVASQGAFRLLRYAGAAYLIFLGAQSLWEATRTGGATPSDACVIEPIITPAAALRQGLLSNLSNPKVLAFFSGLLPQFARTFEAFAGFGLLFCAMTVSWLIGYAVVVNKATPILTRPGPRRIVEAVAGLTLAGLGVRVATERG